MIKHCCEEMDLHLKGKELYFGYDFRARRYFIDYKKEYGDSIQLIKYCPWCGKKLPKSLSEELGNILFEELKLKNWDDPNMPEEFKTDAWWKKRKL